MRAYLISFQTTITNRTKLEETIKSYGTWGKITPDTWIVVTDKTAIQIRDHILGYLNKGDGLIVLRSGTEAAWNNAAASTEWLKKNLTI